MRAFQQESQPAGKAGLKLFSETRHEFIRIFTSGVGTKIKL